MKNSHKSHQHRSTQSKKDIIHFLPRHIRPKFSKSEPAHIFTSEFQQLYKGVIKVKEQNISKVLWPLESSHE
jgi:hypothetical protein